jgi:polysaccharide deacetylase 2 family uncharacterized protein YibQ
MLTVLLSSSAVFVSAQGKIVLVIDDLGNQRRAGRSVIDSPWVTTVAIMPGRPFTEELAQYAFAQGKEIIIHMQTLTSVLTHGTGQHCQYANKN